MSFEAALRLTEILLAHALLQSSLEHLASPHSPRLLFALRAGLCLALLAGIQTEYAAIGLVATGFWALYRFQGPYNGGSDRMGLLITTMLALALTLPKHEWRELAFGYLAMQLTLSYLISGWVKIINPEWRQGRALRDVFQFSAYPISENLRGLKDRPMLLFAASWAVMLFEILFPLSLISSTTLIAALIIAACFHAANACLFGLNRFLWTWAAAFPSLIWLQQRLFAVA